MAAGYRSTIRIGGVIMCKARDADLNMTASAIDETTRCGNGWKEHSQGLREWDATIDQVYVADDTGVDAVRDAFFDGSVVALRFENDNGNGFLGNAIVTGIGFPQPLDDLLAFNGTFKGTGALTILGAS